MHKALGNQKIDEAAIAEVPWAVFESNHTRLYAVSLEVENVSFFWLGSTSGESTLEVGWVTKQEVQLRQLCEPFYRSIPRWSSEYVDQQQQSAHVKKVAVLNRAGYRKE